MFISLMNLRDYYSYVTRENVTVILLRLYIL